MSRNHLILGGTALLCLAIWTAIVGTSLARLRTTQWGNTVAEDRSPEIAGETQVGQLFTAPWPGLSGIKLVLDQTETAGTHEVIFHLRDAREAPADLVTRVFQTAAVRGIVSYSFEFEPIRGSKGKALYFYIESPSSRPGDGLTARYGPRAVLVGAGAILNGQPMPGNLEFHTIYTLSPIDKAGYLLAQMAQGRPSFLSFRGLYAGLAGAYVVVLALFLDQIARAILRQRWP